MDSETWLLPSSTGQHTDSSTRIDHGRGDCVTIDIPHGQEQVPLIIKQPFGPVTESVTTCLGLPVTNFSQSQSCDEHCAISNSKDDSCTVPIIKGREFDSASTSCPPSQEPSTDDCRTVLCNLGSGREQVEVQVCQLAVSSPVFRTLFSERWAATAQDSQGRLTTNFLNDDPQAFQALLQSVSETSCSLPLREDTVWSILQQSDMLQVEAAIDQCFIFLLHRHKSRHHPSHLCSVLEMSHRLGYPTHHTACLQRVKAHARCVFNHPKALQELCHQCMLALVQADDLTDVPEILVNNAVVAWARFHATVGLTGSRAAPGLSELRTVAGPMIHQVRYLLIPQSTLKKMMACKSSSCLLTNQELTDLLNGDVSAFPDTVNLPRKVSPPKRHPCDWRCAVCFQDMSMQLFFCGGLCLVLCFAVVYVPISLLIKFNS